MAAEMTAISSALPDCGIAVSDPAAIAVVVGTDDAIVADAAGDATAVFFSVVPKALENSAIMHQSKVNTQNVMPMPINVVTPAPTALSPIDKLSNVSGFENSSINEASIYFTS